MPGATGVTINGIGTMFGRLVGTKYGTQNTTAANGCQGGGGTNHLYGGAPPFADGVCFLLKLEDTSGGAGTYSLKSYVNGVLADTFTGLAYTLTAGGTIAVGVMDTNGGQWDNLCIATS